MVPRFLLVIREEVVNEDSYPGAFNLLVNLIELQSVPHLS